MGTSYIPLGSRQTIQLVLIASPASATQCAFPEETSLSRESQTRTSTTRTGAVFASKTDIQTFGLTTEGSRAYMLSVEHVASCAWKAARASLTARPHAMRYNMSTVVKGESPSQRKSTMAKDEQPHHRRDRPSPRLAMARSFGISGRRWAPRRK